MSDFDPFAPQGEYTMGLLPLAIPLALRAVNNLRERQQAQEGNMAVVAFPNRPNAPRGCVIRRRPNGSAFAYDPSTGAETEILGFDDASLSYGADGFYGDSYGADDDDDDDEDDIFGAESAINDLMYAPPQEFGAWADRADNKIAKLEDKRDKLKEKSRQVAPWRRNKLNRRVEKLNRKISELKGKKSTTETQKLRGVGNIASRQGIQAAASARNSALVDPVQSQELRISQAGAGMRYNVVAPPGSGRLNKVPMYQDGETNPRNALTVPSGGITSSTTLYTEDLPFAVYRLVGFVCSVYGTDNNTGSIGLVQDLKIKGGSNLFLHENWGAAANYETDLEHLNGLRDYPVVKSPNFAQVDIAASGDSQDVVVMTCDIVADIITDDVYGQGLLGPYAG